MSPSSSRCSRILAGFVVPISARRMPEYTGAPMAAQIIVGSLSGQNWHRQGRRLPPERRFDFFFEKTVAIAKRFGFTPMGIDFGLAGLPSQDDRYLDELAARLR